MKRLGQIFLAMSTLLASCAGSHHKSVVHDAAVARELRHYANDEADLVRLESLLEGYSGDEVVVWYAPSIDSEMRNAYVELVEQAGFESTGVTFTGQCPIDRPGDIETFLRDGVELIDGNRYTIRDIAGTLWEAGVTHSWSTGNSSYVLVGRLHAAHVLPKLLSESSLIDPGHVRYVED